MDLTFVLAYSIMNMLKLFQSHCDIEGSSRWMTDKIDRCRCRTCSFKNHKEFLLLWEPSSLRRIPMCRNKYKIKILLNVTSSYQFNQPSTNLSRDDPNDLTFGKHEHLLFGSMITDEGSMHKNSAWSILLI